MKHALKNVRLIAFDLDDTLYPELSFVKSGFRAVARAVEERFPRAREFYELLWSIFSAGERRRTFDAALRQAGLSESEIAVSKLVQIYRSHMPSIELYPDAREILAILHGKIKIGLITDGYLETQKNKFDALQLEQYVDRAVFTDAAGREAWKPSPWGYQQLMEHFSLQGAQCVYVGDNSLKDFAGAQTLGWITCKIERNEGLYRDTIGAVDYTVRVLTELIDSRTA
jgi:putative hydrolase of the HAD superfamily